ncbi:MAG: hypothetical protein PHW34_00895 [Hespellia sp.]|nr:hypothetical protein [Hespellia sp.]
MILIPMALEVLIVNQFGNSRKFSNINVNYELLDSVSLLGGEIEPGVFEERAPLAPGVHLHFILPDGFTQGAETKDGFEYPAVPDRYLVSRISVNKEVPDKPVITHRSWMIESSYVGTDNVESVTIPMLTGEDSLCRYLGGNYPYEEKRPEGQALTKLTAVSGGSPYFAACYQECSSVFGFHDSCKDVGKGEFIYSVSGWYSKPEQSPFYGLTGLEYQEKINQMGFSMEGASVEDSQLLLHGSVFHVKWEGEMGTYEFGYPGGNVEVAVGNTSSEALSALVAGKLAAEKEEAESVERVLNFLQYNLLAELGEMDGILRAEDRIHYQEFERLESGSVWQLTPQDDSMKKTKPEWDLALAKLNRLQEEWEHLSLQENSKKEELYDVWYTYMLLYSYPSPPFVKKPLTEEQIKQEADCIIEDFILLQKELAEKENSVKEQQEQVKALTEQAGFVLEKKDSGKPFFMPEVPVILAAGEGVSPSDLFGKDGRFLPDDKLKIRSEADVLSSIRYLDGGTEKGWDKTMLAPFLDSFVIAHGVPEAVLSVYEESILLYLVEGFEKTSYIGTLPSPIAAASYAPPWNPLFLEWRLELLTTRERKEEGGVMEDWKLGNLDFYSIFEGTPLGRCEYQGRMFITPHAVKGLGDSILRHLESFRYDEELYNKLKKIGEQISKLPVLSQNMTGMNENLLGKKQAYQFPIFGVTEEAKELAEKIKTYIPEYGEYSLDVNQPFLPIRAGFFKLSKLQVTDTFGQIADLTPDLTRVTLPETLRGDGRLKGYGTFPPRIAGGARLNLQWGDEEPDFICGYLMADFLNGRVNLFHKSGEYVGNLHLIHLPDKTTKAKLEWENRNKLDGHLELLALELEKQAPGVFTHYLELFDQRLSGQISRDETDNQELSMLIGRPIAVVRGALSLLYQGVLPVSKVLEDFGAHQTYGFEKNQYPVRIGDVRYASDGLIGYYCGELDAKTYDNFYPAWGSKVKEDGYFHCDSHRMLSLNGKPELLTFLLDVRGSIHVRTGILPVYEMKPDYTCFSESLKKMKLFLPFYPVLKGEEPVNLPQIGDKNDPFFLLYKADSEFCREAVKEAPGEGEAKKEKMTLVDGYMGL